MKRVGSVFGKDSSPTARPSSSDTSDASHWLDARRIDADAASAAASVAGPVAEAAARCANILSSVGPAAALRYLNGRTRFRFTGIYRSDPPLLRNLYLYDRENPAVNVSGAVSRVEQTFCSIVVGESRSFDTENALEDHRLTAHPARERVLAYCGVPIRRVDGSVWGTLCHYDARPRLMLPQERQVLEAVASLLTCCVIDGMKAE